MEIVVTSREIITPSSPTPENLRRVQLSFLDQLAPPVFMPRILFYPSDQSDQIRSNTEISDMLKKSLSETLTRFYPLAGRLKDGSFVECNDEGVEFLEAQVKCQLSEVVGNPNPAELNKLLPCKLHDSGDVLLAVQVNFFECGGMAIGICISHKIADGNSIVMFTNGWAATARGDINLVLHPHFESATLFPPKSISGYYDPTLGLSKDKIVTKNFVFSCSDINSLKAKYATCASVENPPNPTRVEALLAFIWSRFMAATEGKEDTETQYLVTQAVNLRTRMNPPLPESYFGNIYHSAMVVPSMDRKEEGYGLVTKIRKGVKGINGDYIAKIREADEYFLNFLKVESERAHKGELVPFSFSSVSRLPIYEADFGWGKPSWATSATLAFKNLVLFMPTKSGDGIEAWVNLKEEDMAKFEADKELLSFVCPH